MKKIGLVFTFIVLFMLGCSDPFLSNNVQENAGTANEIITKGTNPPVISLRDLDNKYVCAENAGNLPLVANRTSVGPWEQYVLQTNGDLTVSLRALANNQYVCAENAGDKPLIANRTSIGLWEKFYLINNSDGTVSFRSLANNRIVCVEKSNGTRQLIANRTAIGPWEKFYKTEMNAVKKKWTVLVYMAADNSLSSQSVLEINEMMNVGSSPDVNIIVFWDDGGSHHGYYAIQKNKAVLIKDMNPLINMGNPLSATGFIKYATDYYPAEKYFFIYWNHGYGPDGTLRMNASKAVCMDDNNDVLTEPEQRFLFTYFTSLIGKRVDIVGFNACNMGSVEIAYQYYGLADYMVASQTVIDVNTWDYNFLKEAVNNPSIAGRDFAARVVDYWEAQNRATDYNLAVYNVSHVTTVGYYVNELCNAALNSNFPSDEYKALQSSLKSLDGLHITDDLNYLMYAVINSPAMPYNLKSKAINVQKSMVSLVTREWHNPAYIDRISGISIVNNVRPVGIQGFADYRQLDFLKYTNWDEFVEFVWR
ncbi:MAG: hypothetical protein JW969_19660 [Spirochaetales bacterium]|nr:hypothetical protein [Spirochaetales bacterium]